MLVKLAADGLSDDVMLGDGDVAAAGELFVLTLSHAAGNPCELHHARNLAVATFGFI